MRHDQCADALAAGPAGAAAPVQKDFRAFRDVGVNDQFQIRQIKPACRHIGGDADPGAAIAQRLQGVGALVLAQFTGQRDNGKAAVGEPGRHMIDGGAGGTEDQRILRFEIAQHVDDGIVAVVRRNAQRPVIDVEVLFLVGGGGDANGITLVPLGQCFDGFRHGRREHQRAAFFRRGVEHVFQIIAKPEIKHFVGFVEDHGLEPGGIERAALDVIAQTSRRADDDMRAVLQGAAFVAHVHAADARCKGSPGHLVKPLQLALDLHRQFPCGRDDQRQRRRDHVREAIGAAQQHRRDGHAEGNGLARSGLRRNQGLGVHQFRRQHGLLHGCKIAIAAFVQCLSQRRNNAFELCHVFSF